MNIFEILFQSYLFILSICYAREYDTRALLIWFCCANFLSEFWKRIEFFSKLIYVIWICIYVSVLYIKW